MSANGTTEMVKSNGASAPMATGEIAPPQFMQGFEGAATAPFPKEARAVLAEPVDELAVETKPDGIVYLPGVWYRRQLTKAFGAGAWALVPRQPARVMGEIVIYPGALYVLGRFVSEAVGECAYRANNPNMSYASCLEGARTDALSRCCKDLGMGSELWDAAWRERWQAKFCDKKWVEGKDGGRGKFVVTRKDAKNRQVAALDLMAGAGGEIPGKLPGNSPRQETPADTGEAATAEAYEAIAGLLKSLKFTKGGARTFFTGNFGVDVHTALSATQADAAHALLMAWGQPVYEALTAKLRETGLVRR